MLFELVGFALEGISIVNQIATDGKQQRNTTSHRQARVLKAFRIQIKHLITIDLPARDDTASFGYHGNLRVSVSQNIG